MGPPGWAPTRAGCRRRASGEERPTTGDGGVRWLMSSDVCKHCTHAGCLDVCPTGALFRTEFGTVVVQDDICNGCGYCVPACPYGVIDQRKDDGRAFKCTLCYDRLNDGLMPACAKACPTRVDPVRRPRRAAGAGRRAGWRAARAGRGRRPALRPRPGGRRRRRRRVLPAARRAGGLRPAAGPGRDHPRPRRRMWKHVGARPPRPWSASGVASFAAGRRAVKERAATVRARRGVHVLLRPADHQDADLEDARRPAVPVPRRARRRLGAARRGCGADRPAGR